MSTERIVNSPGGQSARYYDFGAFRLDADARQLFRDGKVVPLAPKTVELLVLLVRRHGELVTKETVMNTLWPSLFVEDTNLSQHISRLRKTLGDGVESERYIETVPRRGYRFVADVAENSAGALPRTRRERVVASAGRRHTVGRARERAALLKAFEDAASGRGLMIGVAGEPGKGKTTIIEEFLSGLEANGTVCWMARGNCSERLAGTEAYLPMLEALESLLQQDSTGSMELRMKSLAPAWYGQIRRVVGEQTTSGLVGAPDQLKRELVGFFRELTRGQPGVVFIDDLHWAGGSTVDLLAYLATHLGEMALLLIVTYRLEELRQVRHPFLPIKQELQGRGVCREWPLEFLTEKEIAQFLSLEFPDHQLSGEFASLVYAKTEGNPLFMVDLLRSLRARGVIVQQDGRWKLSQDVPDLAREVPESVRAIIERKAAQLDEVDHQLLLAASVQGERFDAAVLAAVIGMEPAEIEQRLDILDRDFGLVQQLEEHEFPDGTLTLRYRFVHVLYQNSFYASLTPARRAALSSGVAMAMLRLHGERTYEVATELAVLFERARDFARAVEYYSRAADSALRLFAHYEAGRLARRGRELLKQVPGTPMRAQQELALLSALVVSLMSTRGFSAQEVKETSTRIRELGAERGETRHVVPALYGLFSFYENQAEYQNCLTWGHEFFRLAEARNDPELLIQGHCCLGDALLWMGDFRLALHHSEQSIALDGARRGKFPGSLSGFDPAISSRILRASALWFLGYPDQALQASREAVARARDLSEPPSLVWALFFAAVLHQFRREVSACRVAAEEAIQLCVEHGLADFVAWSSLWRGWALAAEGNAQEGIEIIRESLAEQDQLGSRVNRAMMLALLAEAYQRAGRSRDGLSALDDALSFVERTKERCYEAELHRLKGELLLSQASPSGLESPAQSDAERCFREAMGIARQQCAKSLELRAAVSLGRLLMKQGTKAEGQRLLSDIYNQFTEGFGTVDLQEAKALLSQTA